ncbi:MAG: hypothetical protein AB1Z23_03345 [Eubacteriales bacterium]
MPIDIASAQGAIDKGVNSLHVADEQGAIDKQIQYGYVTQDEGSMDKEFYANWVYKTGTILNSASGGGYCSTVATLTPSALGYEIKPVHVETSALIQSVDAGETSHIKLEAQYKNASGYWVTVATADKYVGNAYSTISISYDIWWEILTREFRYVMTRISGASAEFSNFSGKCTSWWQKG